MAIIGGNPLDLLTRLPKVAGTGDVSLSFSHKYSILIATDVLSDLEEQEKDHVIKGISDVFEMWKYEHGMYPPDSLVNLLVNGKSKALPAREYIASQKEAARQAGEPEPACIKPWECDSYAKTPVRLFFKLFGSGYPPLIAFMRQDRVTHYDYILATVIIMSHNAVEGANQSSDCIEGALKLAQSRMNAQKREIKNIASSARHEMVRKQNSRLALRAKREEDERKVLELHRSYISQGISKPYKNYAETLGMSVAKVSKILKKYGYGRYEK